MSIDPITFEIRSDGRPPKSIYVWEVPVRIWHWLMAICMVLLIASGAPRHGRSTDSAMFGWCTT